MGIENFGSGHNSIASIDAIAVAGLMQAPSDPRVYDRSDIEKATAILRKFGMILPLVIDSEGYVLAGWQAVLAARRLNIETLPAIKLDYLLVPEARELGLALNRFLELGSFDRRKLGALILDLEAAIPDFSAIDIGFEATEIDLAIGSLNDATEEAPLAPGGLAITPHGGIWRLGKHRIGHGDATRSSDVVTITEAKPMDMLCADPPYGCGIQGFVTKRPHREFVQASGDQTEAELALFFSGFSATAVAALRPGALAYIFIDWRSVHSLLNATTPLFGPLLNLLVWGKDKPGMGSLYRSQHELALVHRAPGGRHRNNIMLGRAGRNRSNLLSYPSANTFSKGGMEGDLLADHPTPKNLDMIADLILDCTARGERVLDPFLGSGTTLIAAEKTGRICHALDLDPLYVDIAVRRWQKWTGGDAVLEVSGEAFFERERRTLADSSAGPDLG